LKTSEMAETVPQYTVTIPGDVAAEAFGLHLRIELSTPAGETASSPSARTASLRNWKPGDRVRLRFSSRPAKVKEVLERLRVTGSSRAVWPVLELAGQIVWMQGVEVEPESGVRVISEPIAASKNIGLA
jgi:tRNA(Ile)-lysidine synthase